MNNQTITLRPLEKDDLDHFFIHQQDPEARTMAAFVAEDPTNKEKFLAHWNRVLADSSITVRTILCNGRVSGHILCHSWFGNPELTYWIDKADWGKGVATKSVELFLDEIAIRPIFARIVKDNVGSKRVLEKNGFIISGEDKGFANGRQSEVEEFILTLS